MAQLAQISEKVVAQVVQLGSQLRRPLQVCRHRHIAGSELAVKPGRLPDPHAGAAVLLGPRQLAQLARHPMQRRHHRAVLIDRHQFQRPTDPDRVEHRRFLGHPERVHEHESRQMGLGSEQRPRPELGEDMMPSVLYDRVRRLRAAAVANYRVRVVASHQRFYDGALSFVAKAKPARQDDLRHRLLLGAAARLPPGRQRLTGSPTAGRRSPAYRWSPGHPSAPARSHRRGSWCSRCSPPTSPGHWSKRWPRADR